MLSWPEINWICASDRPCEVRYWDEILGFIVTIKLKETTASDLFRRLNSYSKQHGLYQALKAFGQILKSHFILRVIDEPALRMAIERVLTGSNMCTASRGRSQWGIRVSFCRRRNKNKKWPKPVSGSSKIVSFAGTISIYRKSLRTWMIPANREAFLKALTHGSAASWQHVNLLGEYDFSEERLQDTVGIKPPKLAD